MNKIYEICVVGLGPAGIGFLSSLSGNELKNTVCFDVGNTSSQCNCHTGVNSTCLKCKHCSIVSGIGGASRFSCGKISNHPAGSGLQFFFDTHDQFVRFMDSQVDSLKKELNLVKIDIAKEKQDDAKLFYSKNAITYKYYDVYEFQKESYIVYLNGLLQDACKAGLHIHYNTEITKIEKGNFQSTPVYLITARSIDSVKMYYAKKVVIATGNVIQNTHMMQEIEKEDQNSSYEIGIRIVVPSSKIMKSLDVHGDLKLKYKDGRTYCVSRDGFVIAYSVDGSLFLEGYVNNEVSSNMTNFAIIIKSSDKKGLQEFKQAYSNIFHGIPIRQKYLDYQNNNRSVVDYKERYIPVQDGNIRELFSEKINDQIIDFIESVLIDTLTLDRDDIVLLAPELKENHCYAIDKNFRVEKDIYVIGSATGKFRGILQAWCSGRHCSEIIRR